MFQHCAHAYQVLLPQVYVVGQDLAAVGLGLAPAQVNGMGRGSCPERHHGPRAGGWRHAARDGTERAGTRTV